jgi:hypothetical protein
LLRLANPAEQAGTDQTRQEPEDDDDDQQLDEREAALVPEARGSTTGTPFKGKKAPHDARIIGPAGRLRQTFRRAARGWHR